MRNIHWERLSVLVALIIFWGTVIFMCTGCGSDEEGSEEAQVNPVVYQSEEDTFKREYKLSYLDLKCFEILTFKEETYSRIEACTKSTGLDSNLYQAEKESGTYALGESDKITFHPEKSSCYSEEMDPITATLTMDDYSNIQIEGDKQILSYEFMPYGHDAFPEGADIRLGCLINGQFTEGS